jgi:hypothetical protein
VRKWRVALLSAVLLVVAGWAAMVHHRRAARTHWHKPLRVAVVLLARDEAPNLDRWRAGLDELERWISAEMGRYRRVIDDPPIRFTLYGPIAVERAPKFLPDDDGLWTRAAHAWRLSRELARLDGAAGVGPADVRLYVYNERTMTTPTVEGAGEQGGDAGFVQVSNDEDLTLALAATVHELFHCLGASDRYGADGHALPQDGLSEVDRGRFAEVMVGEVTLSPQKGRTPRSLDELRVGTLTAEELRWSLTPTGR